MAEDKCKVCGHSLTITDTFCPGCGFERHVLPTPVSREVEEYENNRTRNYKEKLEQQRRSLEKSEQQVKYLTEANLKQEELLQNQKQAYDKASSQLSDARKELFQKEATLKEAEAKAQNDSIKIEEQKRRISQLESAAKVVEAQRKGLVEKLTKANDNFTKEVEDHKRTKKRLGQLLNATGPVHVEPEPMPRPRPRQTPPQPQGLPVAKIIFSCDTQTVQENVFDGNNSYTIPANMNSPVNVDAFRIESINGKAFRLYDLCGMTCKINGDKIGTTGMQLYDKDYFSVGNITIQIKLPKMNLRDLLK